MAALIAFLPASTPCGLSEPADAIIPIPPATNRKSKIIPAAEKESWIVRDTNGPISDKLLAEDPDPKKVSPIGTSANIYSNFIALKRKPQLLSQKYEFRPEQKKKSTC